MTPDVIDRTDLALWYPCLRASGVLTPDTHVVRAGSPLEALLSDHLPPGYFDLLARLAAAAEAVGYPCFLRTAHGAAKLSWHQTCWLERQADLHAHVVALTRWSVARNLPTTTWVVRQAVPLASYLTVHGGTPVGREWRVTVDGDQVRCAHPLWPRRGVELGQPLPFDWMPLYDVATTLGDLERRVLLNLSAHVGRFFGATGLGGGWVIDWALVADGRWAVLDMDDPATCWHWPHCDHHPAATPETPPAPIDPADYALDPDGPDGLAALWQLERCLEEPTP